MIGLAAGLVIVALAVFAMVAIGGATENPNPWGRAYCALMALVFAGLAGLVASLVF